MFPISEQPDYTRDIETLLSNVPRKLSIRKETKNIDLVPTLNTSPETLWLFELKENDFNHVLRHLKPKQLYIYGMRFSDLSALENLDETKMIHICWNTKNTNLWRIQKNKNLRNLIIEDFKRLGDISELSLCTHLEELALIGGQWNDIKLDTLTPLQTLKTLSSLELSSVRVKDESLLPLSHLKGLKELYVANQFPTEEFARLSVLLPNTACESFQPYVKLQYPIEDEDVMVIGKRKPFLNSTKDATKLEKYTKQFRVFQDKYR
ncbi:leucine-rich repeat domain-containing protein [Priestia filamentosa]|uniref:leucine-rich repeat domain-containing protein n=1 Tax=Priestia filamentosa TaxID=1402861 RepID=UPI003978FD7C